MENMSEEIVLNAVEIEATNKPQQPQPNQAKLVKRTALVCKNINTYMESFLESTPEILADWHNEENQQKLRLLTNEKKVKCKKDEDTEEDIQRKAERKIRKKAENEVKKAEKQIDKLKGRPKSAYYWFAIDEKPKVLVENPTWNNNKEAKKDVHLELQNRWKEARLTDKLKFYQDKADYEYKNMPIPVKKPFKPYDRDARNREKYGDDPRINKYNKNKFRREKEQREQTSVVTPIAQIGIKQLNPNAKLFTPPPIIRNGEPRFIDHRVKTPPV